MFCVRCGLKNEQHAKHCFDCGLKLQATQVKSKTKIKYFIITLSVVLLSILGLALNTFFSSTTMSEASIGLASENIDVTENDKTDLIKEIQPSVYTISTETGMGSGFLFDEKGSVVTSAHIVAGFTEVWLRDFMGHITTGRVIGISDEFDVALLEVVEYKDKKPLVMDKKISEIGTKIIAFGSPYGFDNSASIGYVAGMDRDFDAGYQYEDLYQFDAQTSPGSSGGPLVDANTGKVIGINTAFLTEDESIGFSIPAHAMYAQLEQWASSPMSREEVAKFKPHEDLFDESFEYAYEDDYEFDEVTLKDFAEDFLVDYESAVEYGNFAFIEERVEPGSIAYEELKPHIVEYKGKEVRFNFIASKALNVVIENDHALVCVQEEFNLIEPDGKTTTIKRERDYTIVMDQYGYYSITDFVDR
ncbi:S1C family serine protease [Paenisporosarcina sp. NPDC076898]|uniref:S1C family serine protease n=1 Tax=unclassified Paenisporosarcina TaxID=2642018 RepID=UPI003D063CA5